MKKKVIAVMLCAGLALGVLAGCGSEENAVSRNTETSSEEKSKEEESEAAEEESEAVQDDSSEQAEDSDNTEEEPGSYLVSEVTFSSGRESGRKEYDVNGNVIRASAGYDGNGNLLGWLVYEYDANGNQVKSGQYDEAGAFSGQAYEYDEHGNMTRQFSIRADVEDTSFEQVYQNEYNSDGKLTAREITTYFNGEPSAHREEYEYDGAGNLVRDIAHTTYGDVVTEYDASGNVTREQGPSGGGAYEYDEYGNSIKHTSLDENGNPTGYSEYRNEYDASGNLIKSSTYDSEGNLQGYKEHEYDAHGNLIKMTETSLYETGEFTIIHEYEYASL